MTEGLDDFWQDLLSEDAPRVARAFAGLGDEERGQVLTHLRRMADEAGWSSGQARRARLALEVASTARPPDAAQGRG